VFPSIVAKVSQILTNVVRMYDDTGTIFIAKSICEIYLCQYAKKKAGVARQSVD